MNNEYKPNSQKSQTRTIKISDVANEVIKNSPDLSVIADHAKALKDIVSSPATRASVGATQALMKDLKLQTGQLREMFSVQSQFTEALKPIMSNQLRDLAKFSHGIPELKLPAVMGFQRPEVTSAKMLYEVDRAVTEERFFQRKGIQAQIESAQILADQRDELGVMREAMNALLKHNLEQATQQSIAFQERDKLEGKRFRLNTCISLIAAVAGIASMMFTAFQIYLSLK